jgi:hypothetical protein
MMDYLDFNEHTSHFKYKEPPDMSVEELLNEISKDSADTLLEKIISWCYQNEYDSKEIGYILAESEHFKRKLHISCVENHQMTDELLTRKIEKMEDFDDWD